MRAVTFRRCAARSAAPEQARGWRAMLGEEWETDGSLFVVTYCSSCYFAEFGEDQIAVDFNE